MFNHSAAAIAVESTNESDVFAGRECKPGDVYYDAIVQTPYHEDDYDMPFTVSVGRRKDDLHWRSRTGPLGALTAQYLCRHQTGRKDGMSFVFGDMFDGARNNSAVTSITALGQDLDSGEPIAGVVERLKALGVHAILYTTHSHLKTESDFRKDLVVKFFRKNGMVEDDFSNEAMRRFCLEDQHWHPAVADTVVCNSPPTPTKDGIKVFVTHAPMTKLRIILPLADPFVIDKEGKTQKEAWQKWAKHVAAFAKLLGVRFDKSCVDVARQYYTPRHAEGAEFAVHLFGGPLLRLDKLPAEDALDGFSASITKSRSKSQTDAGKALGSWSRQRAHGFQITQVIEEYCPERLRGSATSGFTIECPFDEAHSNPGDQGDTGCYAVNAAEGANELFILKCQHGSCSEYTNLDMLGKMIEDEWFPKDVVYDEGYNILELEPDGTHPSANGDEEGKYAALYAAIEALKSPFDLSEAQRIADAINGFANLIAQSDLAQAFKKKTKLDPKRLKPASDTPKRDTSHKRDKTGRLNYRHLKDIDELDLVATFKAQVPFWNGVVAGENGEKRKREPRLTCLIDTPAIMRVTNGAVRFAQVTEAAFRSEMFDMFATREIHDDGSEGPRKSLSRDISSLLYHAMWKIAPQTPDPIHAPFVARDGRVIAEPGWHEDADAGLNVYYDPCGLVVPPVSDRPTDAEVRKARDYLDETLREFHFCDEDIGADATGASRANAAAMLLTPAMRHYFKGCAPLFLIEKPDAGAGATLLAGLPKLLFEGKLSGATPYTVDESEFQKTLTSLIRDQQSIVIFDNVRDFNNRALVLALTQEELKGRELGFSNFLTRPNNFTWIATGISPNLDVEMARRVCRIRLDPKTANVQALRYSKDLNGWVSQNRGVLLWSILTLIRHWVVTDAKPFEKRSLKSFEGWASCIGGVLQSAGIDGFLANPRQVSIQSRSFALKRFAKELFDYMGDKPLAFSAIKATLAGWDHELIVGRDEAAKSACLRGILHEINRRPYELPDRANGGRLTTVALTMKQNQEDEESYIFDPLSPKDLSNE